MASTRTEWDAGAVWTGTTPRFGFGQEHPSEGRARVCSWRNFPGTGSGASQCFLPQARGGEPGSHGSGLSSLLIACICLLLTALPVSGVSLLFNLPDLLTAPCLEVVGSS